MTTVTYVAKRNLSPGHAVGTSYTLQLTCTRLQPTIVKREAMNESMSGVQETFLYFLKRGFEVALAPTTAELAVLLEFLDSVSGRESFDFDPYAVPDQDITPLSVVLVSDPPYTLERAVAYGRGGRDDAFTLAFSLREV